MPDIEMCLNEDCPLKETCYRHEAIPSEYLQSYNTFEPTVIDGEVECEYLIEIKKINV